MRRTGVWIDRPVTPWDSKYALHSTYMHVWLNYACESLIVVYLANQRRAKEKRSLGSIKNEYQDDVGVKSIYLISLERREECIEINREK